MLVQTVVLVTEALDSSQDKVQAQEVVDQDKVASVPVSQVIRCSRDFQIFNCRIPWAKMQKYQDKVAEPSKV